MIKFCKKLFSTQFNKDINYYKILNVDPKADISIIKQNYYQLAKQYHPDLQKGQEEKFKSINNAWDILSNPDQRRLYDQFLNTQQDTQQSQQNYQSSQQYRNSQNEYKTYQKYYYNQQQQFYEQMKQNEEQDQFHNQRYQRNYYNPYLQNKNYQKFLYNIFILNPFLTLSIFLLFSYLINVSSDQGEVFYEIFDGQRTFYLTPEQYKKYKQDQQKDQKQGLMQNAFREQRQKELENQQRQREFENQQKTKQFYN